MPILAHRCLCDAQPNRDLLLLHSVIVNEFPRDHCSECWNDGLGRNFTGNYQLEATSFVGAAYLNMTYVIICFVEKLESFPVKEATTVGPIGLLRDE